MVVLDNNRNKYESKAVIIPPLIPTSFPILLCKEELKWILILSDSYPFINEKNSWHFQELKK